MSKELDTGKNPDYEPDPTRRHLGVGLLAVLGGSLVAVKTAAAFPSSARGDFIAASQILVRYGVTVTDGTRSGHDVLNFETVPLPLTEYTQVAGTRNRLGEIIPCIKTSVFGDDSSFTHFHQGAIIPCVKTTIDGHTLATTEIFDSDQGGIDPCYKVESQMLAGGHIGTITATHFHANQTGGVDPCFKTTIEGHSLATLELFNAAGRGVDNPDFKVTTQMLGGGVLGAVQVTVDNPNLGLSLRVGLNTYNLVNGALQLRIVS